MDKVQPVKPLRPGLAEILADWAVEVIEDLRAKGEFPIDATNADPEPPDG